MIGRTLSHYLILDRVGEGGMGVVYRAHDERLQRDVAIKVLPAGALAQESSRAQFRREALALSKLNHPSVATVHDFDSHGGVDFLVLELVEGATLGARIAEGPLPEREIARLGEQLAEGLAAAHRQGVLHRDIKPANLCVTPEGRLKILDFGLAKLLAPGGASVATETIGATGLVAGTLPYMSPEQLQGRPLDERSDIYAAGAVLYEMATGRRAFPQETTAATAGAILAAALEPPRGIRPQVSPELERIVLKCLEKDPANRYQSARDLAVDLGRLAAPGSSLHDATPRASRRRAPLTKVVGIGVPVALAAILATVLLLRFGPWSQRSSAGGAGGITSLAVLPLANLSGDPSQEYFADGMTDELITRLARVRALRVISRTSVMTYKNRREPLPRIARALHVDAVLEGSVSRSGARVRITAQLIRAATDEHLWAQSYERDMEDILALQGDVARAITQEIRLTLTPGERAGLANAAPVDPEAHDAYLKGLFYRNKRTVPWIEKAIGSFNDALAIDPSYAPAYAGLSTCYSILPAYDPQQSRTALPKARAAALKALELDSTLAEPHSVLAAVKSEFEWDQRGAEVEHKRALELSPNDASLHQWYGEFLSAMGRQGEALVEARRAQELDPLSLIVASDIGLFLVRGGHVDQGIESLRKSVEMDPGFARLHHTLAWQYKAAGRYEEAWEEFAAEDSLLGTRSAAERAAWYDPLRRAYRSSGKEGYYRQLLKQRWELLRKGRATAFAMAEPYAQLDMPDSAFVWLDRAAAEGDVQLLDLKVDRPWDNLRHDPRYAALLRRLGLPP